MQLNGRAVAETAPLVLGRNTSGSGPPSVRVSLRTRGSVHRRWRDAGLRARQQRRDRLAAVAPRPKRERGATINTGSLRRATVAWARLARLAGREGLIGELSESPFAGLPASGIEPDFAHVVA